VFENRSDATEIMDDFSLSREDVTGPLRSIERVNQWLGGTRVMLGSLERAIREPQLSSLERPLVLHDLGCGSGDGLRALARWGERSGRALQLTGVDASPAVLECARERSRERPEIGFRQADFLEPSYEPVGVDIVTLNLCLHHLSDAEIEALLAKCRRAGVRAVLVNDLHRHWLAYGLFYLLCRVCFVPRIARIDGPLSVRKGFTRDELRRFARVVQARVEVLSWCWAFRYRWVLFF
jgi:SAM-dependent methyltransferase